MDGKMEIDSTWGSNETSIKLDNWKRAIKQNCSDLEGNCVKSLYTISSFSGQGVRQQPEISFPAYFKDVGLELQPIILSSEEWNFIERTFDAFELASAERLLTRTQVFISSFSNH